MPITDLIVNGIVALMDAWASLGGFAWLILGGVVFSVVIKRHI